VAVLLVQAACSDEAVTPETSWPEPPLLTDINPDPNVVEVFLVAGSSRVEYLPGKLTDVWAFRDGAAQAAAGTVPGPMLRAKLGDEVIVHFRNELPRTTTLHFHGPRVPHAADGGHVTDHGVGPGESTVTRFVARDAGSFWYHPHTDAYEQIEKGLQGPMVVEGGVSPDVVADRYLVLDDVKVAPDGTLSAETSVSDLLFGRRGNVLLVNGRPAPVALAVPSGTRERWRFVNTANGRFFNLRLPGVRFLVIATDGGLLPSPYWTETLLIAPGERYEVLVTFAGSPGQLGTLETLPYERGDQPPQVEALPLLQVTHGTQLRSMAPLPERWRELPPPDVSADTPVRRLVLGEKALPGGAMLFPINNQVWPDGLPLEIRHGAVEIWEVTNDTPMDHPVHLHGMFFDVLPGATDPPGQRGGWKDTVIVRRGSMVRLAIRFDEPGVWMFQCHILEHADAGSMLNVIVRH
jgi:FtsP/CotA-like multicopper oxidase with cupredoxin domain